MPSTVEEREVWNERTSLTVNAAFKDENGDPVQPESAHYCVHDTHTNTLILDWTAITLGSETDIDIELTSEQMAILDARRAKESHVMTVRYTYAGSKVAYAEYPFEVHNLRAAPMV